ncbi:transmembrane protein 69 [Pristis pectinata]|uniref:transmembrane protein 69 n=1 Tax=Pristis pectinata TaxID=685728 RepID=UPI00223D5E6E|nr:transmembrane protein 69 [Pristis pectinata]
MFASLIRRCFQTNKKIEKLTSLFPNESRKITTHHLSIPNMQRIALHQNMKYLQRSSPFWIQTSSFYVSSQASKMKKVEEPEKRELDLIRYDFKELKNSPKPALYLGCGGLIPFVSAPLFMAITETYFPELAFAQIAYGATILSFLGGTRWGFSIPENSPAKPDWLNLGNSVVPSILAWIALLFHDNLTEAAIMIVMGLGIALHYDLNLLPGYPSWLRALRTVLTVVATFSLIASIIIKNTYPEKRLV